MRVVKTLLTFIFLVTCQGAFSDGASAWGKQGFDLPIVDLDQRQDLQIIVDKEEGQYLGHPSTILLGDGQTILCAYPKGHGRGALILKKSTDGGQTWSERLPTPANWATSREVPTFYHTIDPSGKKLILMFSGMAEKNRMATSEDGGKTFSELKDIPNQKGAIVVMSDLIPLNTGKGHYMATYHHRTKVNNQKAIELYITFTRDGGRTWSDKVVIHKSAVMHLCEGGFVRSPDGKEVALLLRENARNKNSQIMFTQDEGKTWSAPKSMPGALCGDRHQAQEIAGNRLLIQFRDRTPNKREGNQHSPTEGDWCGWVGTWDDLKQGREGQYRIRFKDNKHGWDTTYPAAELLADGTLVCTTYGHFDLGKQPYILSFRFKIEALDQLTEKIVKEGQPPVTNHMGKKTYLYDPDQPETIRNREP